MTQTSATSPAPPSEASQREAKICTISQELYSLTGQKQAKIARWMFRAFARSVNASAGHMFLVNRENQPVHCLALQGEHLRTVDPAATQGWVEQGLTGWAFHQRRGLLVANLALDPRWSSWAESQDDLPKGSALAVPFLLGGHPLGALALLSDKPQHFAATDLELATQLANQTSVILQNSRLRARVEQKQETIDALCQTAHTTSTSLALDQVVHTTLHHAAQAIPYQGAMVLLQEEEHLRPITVTGFQNPDKISQRVFTPSETPALFQILHREQPLVVQDGEPATTLGLTLSEPIRTWAFFPLIARGETQGLAILASSTPHAYDKQNVRVITAFVDQIASTVAGERLAQETNKRLRELSFLNETGQAITSTLNLDRVLHMLLERVRDLLQVDAVSIALKDEHTGELIFEAASGEGAAGVLGAQLKPGQGIAGWVAETGKPLIVPDVYKDTRFFPDIDKKTGMTTQAILCVPIILKGQVVGIIEALNPDKAAFNQHAIKLLGGLSGLAATAIDNARLFNQVRNAEARYAGLFEDSVNPIIITDLKGIIVDINRNACALLGQTQEALSGTKLTSLRSADGSLDFAAPHRKILSGQDETFQTIILSNGQRVKVEVTGKQITVKGTTLIQWIGRDISAESELEQLREDMTRMIIHDLRNPLSNIMNSLDVMQDVIREKDTSISLLELLKIAQRSGQRLHQLISSILDMSRLEAGQEVLDTKPTNLLPVLKEVIEFVEPQANIREIQLVADLDPHMPKVEIDRDMISRVTLNLMDNAIKFTQIGGKVKISTNVLPSEVEIAVTDNGPGIPANKLDTIFEKFVRVRSKDGPQGTGLGLAFCQLAVQAHGGRIWVESRVGHGSTFYLTLPISQSGA